jgi:hypothetical protein
MKATGSSSPSPAGMQPQQQILFLSDGADTLQRLHTNIAPEAEHALDWFYLSMRLTVVRQMIKDAWTDEATIEARRPHWIASSGCCAVAMRPM